MTQFLYVRTHSTLVFAQSISGWASIKPLSCSLFWSSSADGPPFCFYLWLNISLSTCLRVSESSSWIFVFSGVHSPVLISWSPCQTHDHQFWSTCLVRQTCIMLFPVSFSLSTVHSDSSTLIFLCHLASTKGSVYPLIYILQLCTPKSTFKSFAAVPSGR